MTSEAEKREAVARVWRGETTVYMEAVRHDVTPSTIERWITRYGKEVCADVRD